MKIIIQSIADKGIKGKERLVLKVKSDTDIGDYIIIQAEYSDEQVTTSTYNTFWFPYKAVSAGDLVVLYSKSGRDNEKEFKSGLKTHFFYWGLDSSIWGRKDRAPVLLHSPEWISKKPEEL